MDIKSKNERSQNMAKIRSKNTKPEIAVRKIIKELHIRYTTNNKDIFGHPDIYVARYKTTIFVHGCFWHRHTSCKYAYSPKSNSAFWENKFLQNMKRDEAVKNELLKNGFRILVVWECSLKGKDVTTCVSERILSFLKSDSSNYCEI